MTNLKSINNPMKVLLEALIVGIGPTGHRGSCLFFNLQLQVKKKFMGKDSNKLRAGEMLQNRSLLSF